MFEALALDTEQPKVAVSSPGPYSGAQECHIPLDKLSEPLINEAALDLLLVSGALPEQTRVIEDWCDKAGTVVAFIEHPSNDTGVIWNVMLNLMGKLSSGEMPNNIDVADGRNLCLGADCLLAFEHKTSAQDFLESGLLVEAVGGIYLAHGETELAEYQATSQQLVSNISEYGYICSSFYRDGRSECTVLLAVRTRY